MKRILKELLPERVSDEAAYHISNFFMMLALEVDDLYFAQTIQYHRARRLRRDYDDLVSEPPF